MAENDKTQPAASSDGKPDKGKPKVEPPADVKPLHAGYPGRGGNAQPTPVAALASATGTSAVVLAALKAAYRWTDETQMTRGEFLRKRDAWLARPAREV